MLRSNAGDVPSIVVRVRRVVRIGIIRDIAQDGVIPRTDSLSGAHFVWQLTIVYQQIMFDCINTELIAS